MGAIFARMVPQTPMMECRCGVDNDKSGMPVLQRGIIHVPDRTKKYFV